MKTHLHFYNRIIFISALIFCASILTLYAGNDTLEKTQFKVFRDGRVIGECTGEMMNTPNGVRMILSTKVKSRVVLELRVDNTVEVFLNKGNILMAKMNRTVNGNTTHQQNLNFINGAYKLSGNKSDASRLPRQIAYTTTQLYFSEPIGYKQLYAESAGNMVPITQKAPGIYVVRMPDGKEMEYHYSESRLVKVIVHSTWGLLVLQRV